jgi:peptidoglycan/xylan/chitin deacetylase (PgdA/CDA1 family)
VQDGMVVADHSWSHPDFQHSTDAQQKAQILDDANLIQKITGVRPRYFRYPYGLRTKYVEAHLASWGFGHSVYWNDAGNDWYPLCPGASAIIKRLTVDNPNLHNGSVLLLHDSSLCGFKQLQFLPRLIVRLKAMGYSFATLGSGPYPYTPQHPGHE